MSRALRRHPSKQGKASRGRAPQRAIPRTSSARPASGGDGGGILSWRPRFLMDIINELRKVVWPSRQDATYLTFVVVVVSILIGAVLGGIDIGFGWLIDETILR
jgi:preprotein translocase SecE subunit